MFHSSNEFALIAYANVEKDVKLKTTKLLTKANNINRNGRIRQNNEYIIVCTLILVEHFEGTTFEFIDEGSKSIAVARTTYDQDRFDCIEIVTYV